MKIGSHFLYKGIDIIFTEGADKIACNSQEGRIFALEAFFEDNPLNSIKWVTQEEAEGKGDDSFPMYHMTNTNNDTLLFWPLLDTEKSNMMLLIEDRKERPDIDIDAYYELRE